MCKHIDGYVIHREYDKDYYLGVGDLNSLGVLQEVYGKETVVPIYIHSDNKYRDKRAELNNLDLGRLHMNDWMYSSKNLAERKVYMYFENNSNLWDCVMAIKVLINGMCK